MKFYVDVSYVCPERAYRLGDLANTFPPGIVLDKGMDHNQKIVEVEPIDKNQ